MAHYILRERRNDDSGAEVRLYQDANDGSWAVGRAGDAQLDPVPLAAFASSEAARKYADQHFKGSGWQPVKGVELRV